MRSPSPFRCRSACFGTAAALLLAAMLSVPEPTRAQSVPDRSSVPAGAAIERHIDTAARRFGLPPRWIRAVIAVESAGEPRALSAAGAMGLMQIMPGTWAELRAAHGLGDDPFDPRDNILAGAAYLRALHDRFGAPGFLAAYNAGPGRYAEHLAIGRPLPRETRDYVARLAPVIGGDRMVRRPPAARAASSDWRDAPLFVTGPGARSPAAKARTAGADEPASPKLFVPPQTRGTP